MDKIDKWDIYDNIYSFYLLIKIFNLWKGIKYLLQEVLKKINNREKFRYLVKQFMKYMYLYEKGQIWK